MDMLPRLEATSTQERVSEGNKAIASKHRHIWNIDLSTLREKVEALGERPYGYAVPEDFFTRPPFWAWGNLMSEIRAMNNMAKRLEEGNGTMDPGPIREIEASQLALACAVVESVTSPEEAAELFTDLAAMAQTGSVALKLSVEPLA